MLESFRNEQLTAIKDFCHSRAFGNTKSWSQILSNVKFTKILKLAFFCSFVYKTKQNKDTKFV